MSSRVLHPPLLKPITRLSQPQTHEESQAELILAELKQESAKQVSKTSMLSQMLAPEWQLNFNLTALISKCHAL